MLCLPAWLHHTTIFLHAHIVGESFSYFPPRKLIGIQPTFGPWSEETEPQLRRITMVAMVDWLHIARAVISHDFPS